MKLTEYYSKEYVDNMLNDYVLKSELDALKTENENLKAEIENIKNLLNNIYTKTESDEKYLNKANVINEENYTRTDILNNGGTSRFSFKDGITIETLIEKGFVLNGLDATSTTSQPVEFNGKYSNIYQSENQWDFQSNDSSKLIRILETSDGTAYAMDVFRINGDKQSRVKPFVIQEWYIEEGYKFDSYNVYCKEIVDEKLK